MPDLQTRQCYARELIAALRPIRLGDRRYQADSPAWFGERLFGGHVVAIAVAAAMTDTGSPHPPNSLHGYFLRPVEPRKIVTATVDTVRTGRSFSTYEVRLSQDEQVKFVLLCQFHAPEEGPAYQPQRPDVVAPGEAEEQWRDGPFEVRAIGPTELREDGTYASTRRAWIRLLAPVPHDVVVTTALAAYVSDMTGNAFRPLSLDEWDGWTDASLDHAVWFHRPLRVDDWMLFDLHCLINQGGRSLVRGQMYDADGGLCLSMAQELLIRRTDR